jgi:hypothetical protein
VSFLGVTFSGVDDTADVERLREIRSHYFTIEWGLRLAAESQGPEAGIPSVEWIGQLAPEFNLSAQLWGKTAVDFLLGKDTELMSRYSRVWPQFHRIQINSADGIDRVNLPAFTRLMEKNPDKQLILRIRDRNLELADVLLTQGISCSILFDDAQEPAQKKWPKGPKRFAGCGYAGGLGADNIYKQLSPILNAAQTAERWWVEIDSGLQAQENGRDVFSLASCKRTIREFDSFFLDYTI